MRVNRRQLLRLMASGAALGLTAAATSKSGLRSAVASPPPYPVGVANGTDAYEATLRAVEANAGWPGALIAGRRVVIKPNLVTPKPASTGATTDPRVVQALVDLSLQSGAARVEIVETSPRGPHFSACGYDFFSGYGEQVALVDLAVWPVQSYRVPSWMAYRRLYLYQPLMEPDVVLISAGKLKTHSDALVSLSMKNLFGLPPWRPYFNGAITGRFAMHERSVSQTVIDLNLARPIHFAVVDGIWAMEGRGPITGTPVAMDVVLAGSNALAVDRACLAAMQVPQDAVQHLRYASDKGLGPTGLADIALAGDSLPSRPFLLPDTGPVVDMPQCVPVQFSPSSGQSTTVSFRVDRACTARVEIVRVSDFQPAVELIRTLQDWAGIPSGENVTQWDGRDDAQNVVAPGRYGVRVVADAPSKQQDNFATGWAQVV